MTALVTKILATMATATLLMCTLLSMQVSNLSLGSAGEIPAVQGIATTTAVGPQETITIFSDKSNCSSRVISTTDGKGQAIQVLFGDPTNGDIASTSLSEVVGHLQAGSTTQAYDAGIYGCGRWTVHASASTTLLISEFR